ncbi:MAG: hypothetical protein WCX48_12355 [Bacteroidales bacterium]
MRLNFIHEFCTTKKYEGQEILYLQQKYDGHRITVLRQPPSCDNPIVFYTRSQSNLFPEMAAKAKRFNIWHWIEKFYDLPPYSSVDGELTVPGKPASYIKTAIKENDPALRFTAFAFPWLNNQRRYTDPLEWAFNQCSLYKIPFIPFIKLDTVQCVDPDVWLARAKPETEGWVLKRYHYSKWYKLKRIHTMDLVVTGFTVGKGKYKDTLGAMICSAYDQKNELKEICQCSGMTDEERFHFSQNDVGRVCEVQFQEVSSLGRLRHPIFVRWRDDEKSPQECTLAQEPELMRYWNGLRTA